MPRLNEASPKMKKWVRYYLKDGKGIQAALKAYPGVTYNSAQQISHKNKKHPLVRAYMAELLDMVGASDEQIAKDLRKIVKAGTTDKALKDTTVDQALRGLDMTIKLKDLYPAQTKKIDKRVLNLNYTDKSPEELNDILSGLADDIKKFQQMQNEVKDLK